MSFTIKSLNLSFYQLSQESLKNGDVKFFGYIDSPYLKTFCFISERQISYIQHDFKLEKKELKLIDKPKPTLWSKNTALKESKWFNIGLLFLLNKEKKHNILYYKRNSFLQFILSDQPEIFHNIKNKYCSYKDIRLFRFSDFNFDKEFERNELRKLNSICYQVKDFKNSSQLAEFVFKEVSPKAKKMIMNCIFNKTSNDTVFVNYELIRIVFFLQKIFNNEFIFEILQNHFSKIKKCNLLKDILYSSLNLESHFFGVVKYINQFKDDKKKLNELLRFNVPHHILPSFSLVMKEPFDYFKLDVTKESDALYFFNNINRDWGRLKSKNYSLESILNPKFSKVISQIDNLTYKDFSYIVAKDYFTLINWGSELRNCAGNFYNTSSYKEKLLVGIFKNNKIAYLASLQEYGDSINIDQLEGFKNSIPSKDVLIDVFEPFKELIFNPMDNFNKLTNPKKYY